jgi:hypothetical protein
MQLIVDWYLLHATRVIFQLACKSRGLYKREEWISTWFLPASFLLLIFFSRLIIFSSSESITQISAKTLIASCNLP